MSTLDLVLLLLAALAAGFVDAVAGGGGLIQVPALITGLSGELPATVFGTNKLASIFGTGSAAWRYARKISLPWAIALPAAGSAFVFSFAGAASVAWLPKDVVRPLVLALLVAVMIYTLVKPSFGVIDAVSPAPTFSRRRALLIGVFLGFYDGFFGPGTGSFLIFAFVRWFGLDFLRASSAAKVVNLATNAAALAYFVPAGYVLVGIGASMAVANVVGAQIGSRIAIRQGSGFVRWVFLVMAGTLIVRVGFDTFYR